MDLTLSCVCPGTHSVHILPFWTFSTGDASLLRTAHPGAGSAAGNRGGSARAHSGSVTAPFAPAPPLREPSQRVHHQGEAVKATYLRENTR